MRAQRYTNDDIRVLIVMMTYTYFVSYVQYLSFACLARFGTGRAQSSELRSQSAEVRSGEVGAPAVRVASEG